MIRHCSMCGQEMKSPPNLIINNAGLWWNGQQVRLSKTENIIVGYLYSHVTNAVAKSTLWEYIYQLEPSDWPSPDVLNVLIFRIRKKIEAIGAPIKIKTVWGFGWVLIQEKERTI